MDAGILSKLMPPCNAMQVNLGKLHFQTIHARTGLATLLLAVAAPMGGLLSFKRLGLLAHFPEGWQPGIKQAHRMVRTAAELVPSSSPFLSCLLHSRLLQGNEEGLKTVVHSQASVLFCIKSVMFCMWD